MDTLTKHIQAKYLYGGSVTGSRIYYPDNQEHSLHFELLVNGLAELLPVLWRFKKFGYICNGKQARTSCDFPELSKWEFEYPTQVTLTGCNPTDETIILQLFTQRKAVEKLV